MPLNDSPYLLPHLPPGSGEGDVGLSLYPLEVAAAQRTLQQLADALNTIRQYDQLQTVIYTDGSAVGGVKRGGSSAVVTSGNPGNPIFLNVRHQYGPK
jgi:outer membrane receptor protein involved in Fe transport